MSLEEVAKTVNGTTSLNAAAYRRIVGGRDQPSEKVFNDKDDTPTPLEIVAKKEYEEGVLSHVAKLRPRLQEAVSRRYGIGEYRMRGGMKQGEVAKEMGVSKQRVYQLENAALAEIRELMAGKKYQEDGSDHVRMDRGRQVRLAPPSKAQKRKKKISLSRKAKKERGVNC
jgi:DNA-directed RNA polymerase sigma subunit (sigma70/sigma32)